MFPFFRRSGLSHQERLDLQDYLRESRQRMEELEKEYQEWLQVAGDSTGRLHLQGDPTGQHAAVYLWRVAAAARDFVQHEPPKSAQAYHEAFSLCLEARGGAADTFREAAERTNVVEPTAQIADANAQLDDADAELQKAREAIVDIEHKLASA